MNSFTTGNKITIDLSAVAFEEARNALVDRISTRMRELKGPARSPDAIERLKETTEALHQLNQAAA